METLVFILSMTFTFMFVFGWFSKIKNLWNNGDNTFVKVLFSIVPFLLLLMYVITTTMLAASDVVNDPYYIIYYILMGFAFTYITNFLLFSTLNVSWVDDALNSNNKAATLLISASMIGFGFIYSGANIGEGPGFYTVVVASMLGVITFILLLSLLNLTTKIITRVTHDHNMNLSIRLSLLVLGLSLILAKASSGTWTSFTYTLIEFLRFWPSIILILIAIILERIFKNNKSDFLSFMLGLFYLLFSLIMVIYLTDLIDFVKLFLGN